jgi:adenylate cyclase
MLNGAFINEVTDLEALPWFFLFSIFMVGLCFLLRPFLGFLFTVMTILGELYYFILVHLPDYHAFFPIASLMLITFFSYLFASLFIYFIKERKSRRLKMAFGSYVSREVVEQIAKENKDLKLGGEKKELTVLFSDIRSFTSISEKLKPEEIVQLLNEYLSSMTECIFLEKGTIDKYIGDAIMAIFGAPIQQDDHAERACRVALAMTENLEKLNAQRLARGEDRIEIGIGVNTGEMTVGNIGSKRRFDYTVIGDEVNLASRLEGLTKVFGASILISDSTFMKIDPKAFTLRYLGKVIVKGRSLPTGLYEILPGDFDPKLLDSWNHAMVEFESANFEEAMKLFKSYEQSIGRPDRSSDLFIGRCSEALKDIGNFSPILVVDTK